MDLGCQFSGFSMFFSQVKSMKPSQLLFLLTKGALLVFTALDKIKSFIYSTPKAVLDTN